MKIEIIETNNGFIVKTSGGIKTNGTNVFRYLDYIQMLEFVAKALFDKRFEIKEK